MLFRRNLMNRFQPKIGHLLTVLVLLGSVGVRAQDNPPSGQAPADQSATGQDNSGPPPAATGGVGEPSLENPPLTGLDTPRTELPFGGRSYLVPGMQFSESANSNLSGNAGSNSGISASSQVLASLDLQKLWKRYAVGLDYVGGGDFYTGPTFNGQGHLYQVHTMASDQRILWRTGQLSIRDTFDYLPEGTFGFGSVGGAGSFGSVLGGVEGVGTGLGGGLAGGTPTGQYGGGSFGSAGFEPRIDNSSIIDVTQELSARSSFTIGGGFNYSDFLDKAHAPFPVINSQQWSLQAGYNRLLGPSDQIGFLYALQEFHFPHAGSGSLRSQVWNLLYSHRITGRLNFVVAGGPQITDIYTPGYQFLLLGIIPVTVPPSTTRNITGNGSVTFGYTVSSRTSAQVLYQRFISPGSGFLPGANTNAVRGSLSHVFHPRWTGSADLGYSFNSALHNANPNAGLNAQGYKFWYVGGALHRQLSEHFDVFASYQFNDFGGNRCESTTGNTNVCGQSAKRQTGLIGIDWRPRPIRLD